MTGTLHIVLAMKPTQGNFAENALRFGVSGINVDGCRIQSSKGSGVWGTSNVTINTERKFNASPGMTEYRSEQNALGRFPANVILGHAEGCVLKGSKKVKSNPHLGQKNPELVKQYGGGSFGDGVVKPSTGYADVEGNEVVEDWECVESCPVRKLGEQSGESVSTGGRTIKRSGGGNVGSHKESEKWWTNENPSFGDTSTAARYFHIVKELELYDTESD